MSGFLGLKDFRIPKKKKERLVLNVESIYFRIDFGYVIGLVRVQPEPELKQSSKWSLNLGHTDLLSYTII